MSYILDALRKSEQERQAAKPENVTGKLLVNPPQPANKPFKWLLLLGIVNTLALAFIAWFFISKADNETQQGISASIPQNISRPGKSESSALLPAQPSAQNTARQNSAVLTPDRQQPYAPSIAQLIEEKKDAIKQSEIIKPRQQNLIKKFTPVKKDSTKPKAAPPQTKADRPETVSAPSAALPFQGGTPQLQALTKDYRDNLPNFTINVFSYAEQPEDRFVIIDMVKYKTGQLIKGSVKLKEIRQDSIVLQYGGNTFKVERP